MGGCLSDTAENDIENAGSQALLTNQHLTNDIEATNKEIAKLWAQLTRVEKSTLDIMQGQIQELQEEIQKRPTESMGETKEMAESKFLENMREIDTHPSSSNVYFASMALSGDNLLCQAWFNCDRGLS